MDKTRVFALPCYDRITGRVEKAFRVSKDFQTYDEIRDLYTLNVLTERAGRVPIALKMLMDDAPESKPPLPVGYALIGDYEIYIERIENLPFWESRISQILQIEMLRQQTDFWGNLNDIIKPLAAEILKDVKSGNARRSKSNS